MPKVDGREEAWPEVNKGEWNVSLEAITQDKRRGGRSNISKGGQLAS